MPALTDKVYLGFDKVYEGNSLKVANKGLPKVNRNFQVYDNDFFHTYQLVL